jgi:hypothetical protein
MKTKIVKFRNRKGAMTAEYVTTLYVLFFFLFFPMLNYGILGMRAFFLWFACNEACITGIKMRTLCEPVTIGGISYGGAASTAAARASNIANAFGGIHWPTGQPVIYVNVTPMTTASGASATSPLGLTYAPAQIKIGPPYSGPVLPTCPDVNNFICTFVVAIQNAALDPLIPMNFPPFNSIPGLGAQLHTTVSCQQQFENIPGLTK